MKSTLSFFLSTQYLGGYSHCSSCVQLMAFKLLVSVRFVCIGHVLKLLMILLKRRNFDLNILFQMKKFKNSFPRLKIAVFEICRNSLNLSVSTFASTTLKHVAVVCVLRRSPRLFQIKLVMVVYRKGAVRK